MEHPTVERHRRRSKGKERALQSNLPRAIPRPQDVPLPSSPEAGPSKLSAQQEWEYVPIAQNEISSVPPIWSRDGRFYFMAAGGSVQVHSSTKRLSTIPAHREPITAMMLHPSNPLHLITSSLDGTIRVWDWVGGRHVKTMKQAGPVLHMVTGRLDKWYIFCTVDSPNSKKSGHSQAIFRLDLAGRSTKMGKLSATPTSLLISPSSTYLVALAANKAYAYRLSKDPKAKPSSVKFVSDQIFTCGAFSPQGKEEWFATGDVKGVIRLWHGLQDAFRQIDAEGADDGKKDKRLPTTSLHWHAHAVAALAFTHSGAQLLSVGEESVLVQWHLASGKREYIPRLGGRPIISLAVKGASRGDEEEWWMGFSDGSVSKVGGSSGHVTQVGQGVKLDPLRPTTSSPYPLAIQPTGHLVVPSSHPSTLQFIDASSSSVSYDLEVAPSNRVARRDDKEIIPVAVEHVAFNRNWMATIEGRQGDEAEGGGDVRTLKIWRYEGGQYKINTQLPRPHGSDPVTAMALSEYLLTCSSTEAKLWSVRQAKKSDQGKTSSKKTIDLFWSTRSTFNYRNMQIHAATFSPDGTIVVLVHGPVVTLWDVESNVLLKVLDAGRQVDKCLFVGDRYLVAAGAGLVVWDLLSCEVVWSLKDKVDHLIHFNTSFATTSSTPKKTTINIYHPSCSVSQTATIPIALLKVTSIRNEFIGVAPSGEIYRFGQDVTASAPATNTIATTSSKSSSIWQEMFGKDAFLDDLAPPQPTVVVPPTIARPTDIFDGPSHTLPPVGLLFDAFMTQLLKPRSESEVKAEGKSDIKYETVEAKVEPVPTTSSKAHTKKVTEEEMKDLESFFKDVLSSAPTANGSMPKMANGDSTPKSTPVKANGVGSGKKVNSVAQTNGTPSDESREKQFTKKRRAPKE